MTHMKRAVLLLLLLPATAVLSRRGEEKQRGGRHLEILKRQYPHTDRAYCVEHNKEIDTDVAVSFKGRPDLLGPSDYTDLENSFLEAYNNVRRGFCDDLSREVVAVSVDDTSIEESTSASQFTLRFEVKMGCDGCGADTDLFFVPKVRRELSGNDGLFTQMEALLDEAENGKHDRTNSRSLQGMRGEAIRPAIITRPGGTAPPPPAPPAPTSAPVVAVAPRESNGDECCPPNGESRGPTGEEFALEFDNVYKKKMGSARKLQTVPIEQVLTAFELSPVDCSEAEEDIETFVYVELSTSGDFDSLLRDEIVALENSFKTSYNSFSQGELCDPLFRRITSVFIENYEEGRRNLASNSPKYKYTAKGKCRGCAKNPRLFGDSSDRRQLASSAPRWLYNRELRFMMSDDTCFCAVGAEERGVEEEEFTVVYNEDVVRLQKEGVLTNVDGVVVVEEELPPTWSPTTSPTNYPTAPTDSPVPSPSPSSLPTL